MSEKLTKRQVLVDLGFEDTVVFDNPSYDNAIIGTDEEGRAIYSYDLMVECLMIEDGMDYEEACEFIDYNTIRALPYIPNHPIILYNSEIFNDEIYDERYFRNNFDAVKESEKVIKWIKEWFDKNGPDCNAIVGMSGGKDSTIVAGLCVKALGKDRVIGISMPDDGQGINEADKICEHLGIKYYCIPIDGATGALKFSLTLNGDKISEQTEQNIPPRIRMTTLYGFAQSHNGRVMGTCNASENYIGYFTRYGDGASDVEPLGNFTVTEVKAIGHAIGIPYKWVEKIPDDGLPNSCPDDEKFAKWGFSYALLDRYIAKGTTSDSETDRIIREKHNQTKFKLGMGEVYDPDSYQI